jgi:hypothetical protein
MHLRGFILVLLALAHSPIRSTQMFGHVPGALWQLGYKQVQ